MERSCHGTGQAGRKGFGAHLITNQHQLLAPVRRPLQARWLGYHFNSKTAIRSPAFGGICPVPAALANGIWLNSCHFSEISEMKSSNVHVIIRLIKFPEG